MSARCHQPLRGRPSVSGASVRNVGVHGRRAASPFTKRSQEGATTATTRPCPGRGRVRLRMRSNGACRERAAGAAGPQGSSNLLSAGRPRFSAETRDLFSCILSRPLQVRVPVMTTPGELLEAYWNRAPNTAKDASIGRPGSSARRPAPTASPPPPSTRAATARQLTAASRVREIRRSCRSPSRPEVGSFTHLEGGRS